MNDKPYLRIAVGLLALAIGAGPSAGADQPLKIPDGIRYKKASAETNARARQKLQAAFSARATAAGTQAAFGKAFMVGPLLWKTLTAADTNLVSTVRVHTIVPISGDKPQEQGTAEVGSGALRTPESIARFLAAFRKQYQFPAALELRPLTTDELKAYWALIPYDIEEPIFVGKIGGRNVLLHLLSSDLTVAYIEDLDLARHKEMMAQARAAAAGERDPATERFVNEAVKNFGTREKAGAAACMLGWSQLHKGALDDALNRFKQAQLFDPRNGEGFWGEGATILFMIGREKRPIGDMSEVIRLEEKAFGMLPNNSRMMGDLANAYSNLAKLTPENQTERRKELLEKAAALCEKSSQIEPGYGQIYFLWAIALMEQGKYRDAWEKMEKARQLKADMSADIVENLKKRMPDPYEQKGPQRDGAKPVSPTESRRGADARGRPSP